jgi:pyruvate, orthophosphate dikinase
LLSLNLLLQVRALFEAAVTLLAKGMDPRPEIMVPLVGSVAEFTHQKKIIENVAQQVFQEHGKRVQYKIGTMVIISSLSSLVVFFILVDPCTDAPTFCIIATLIV